MKNDVHTKQIYTRAKKKDNHKNGEERTIRPIGWNEREKEIYKTEEETKTPAYEVCKSPNSKLNNEWPN